MGTDAPITQLCDQLFFKCSRNCVLQPLRFVVDFVPCHTERLGQHAFNQVMSKDRSLSNLPTFGGELNTSVTIHSDHAVFR